MATWRAPGGSRVTSVLSMEMRPAVVNSRPETMRSNVDLPQPDGPTKTTNSPEAMSRSISLITSTAPKFFRTLSKRTTLIP